MAKFQLNLTASGVALLGQALTSKVLTFTQMALGDGAYSGSAMTRTALVSEVKRVDITSAEMVSGGSEVLLRGVVTYADLPDTFNWREFGIYAQDPSGGADILYAYANAGDDYDTIGGTGALTELILRARVVVSDASDLTVTVQSGSLVYVSPEELEEALAEVDARFTQITNIIQQVTGVDPSDPEAEPPSGSMVVTLSHAKSGTMHNLTGLGGRTGIIPCQFKATGDYAEGEVFQLDGTPYTARQENGDTLSDGQFVSGAGVAAVVDTEGKRINFKGGGGVGAADLALATATEATVFSGKTFYAGESKELRTGTALSQAVSVTADNIPPGVTAYNQAGQVITGNGSGVFKYMIVSPEFSANRYSNDLGKSYTYNTDFKIFAAAFDVGSSSSIGYYSGSFTWAPGIPDGIIIGDQTQTVVCARSFSPTSSAYVGVIATKTGDKQIKVECAGVSTSGGSAFFRANLYIFGV